MKGFTVGILAGSAMAAVGIGYLLNDKKTYNKMMKKGKKLAMHAEDMIEDMK